MDRYFGLSYYGVRYFMGNYVDSDTVPASSSATGVSELEGVIKTTLGKITKDETTLRTLNGDGWETVIPLGQGQDEGEFTMFRGGDGGVYDGTGSTTHNKIKKWVLDSTKAGGATSPKCIVEVIPRGASAYEGTCYFVIPKAFSPDEKSTENAQQYSFTVKPFGPPIPLTVTENEGVFTFTKIS